ncbi:MAG: type II secretion system minor pseudopilin GspH [Pseudomonadota bacterium]
MPALHRHRPSSLGFTLLEVLMVVLLVGIMSSVVVLSINTGGAERHLPEESQRLAALIEQAANEAVMQNQEFGLRVTAEGYGFLCLDEAEQRWGACDNEIFRERELPEGLELQLVREGSIKALPTLDDAGASTRDRQRRDGEGGAGAPTPDLFLLSSGESSAARLELRVREAPEMRSEISVDEVGRVRIDADSDAAEAGDGNAA